MLLADVYTRARRPSTLELSVEGDFDDAWTCLSFNTTRREREIPLMSSSVRPIRLLLSILMLTGAANIAAQDGVQSADYLRMKSVGDVEFSPDRGRIAYSISNNDGEGRPYSQLWIMEVASGRTVRIGDDRSRGSQPSWSPDGKQVAFSGKLGEQSGLFICRADGSEPQFLAAP